MLDTNMASYVISGVSRAARDRLATLGPSHTACISSITEAELRFGLSKLQLSPARIAAVERFLSHTLVLPWGRKEASVYGAARAKQEALGKPLDSLDMLFAAHAIATHCILVTRNQAFHQVAGLIAIEDWATDLSK
jgi:tRNA(fMet)-specific endonuclease VapC